MDKKTKQISIMLSMENELHRKAWAALSAIPKGKRTEYVCKRLTERERADELASLVKRSVAAALNDYGGAIEKPNITTQSDEAGEIENNFFGFLSALQSKGDDEN